MPPTPITGNQPDQVKNQNLEIESIDFFVRLMSMLGMPRSVGEIYGLLYFSPVPLPMDQIVSRLGISLGSASQGLKTLRSLKAVRTNYVPGDRRITTLQKPNFVDSLQTSSKKKSCLTWKVQRIGSKEWKIFSLSKVKSRKNSTKYELKN